MVLQEVCAALNRLLDNNESIVITDSTDVYAEEVIYYLTQMFNGLRCDFKVIQLTDLSYEITLYQ